MASLMTEAQEAPVPKQCQPIVDSCLDVIKAADRSIKELQYQSELQKQLNKAVEAHAKHLQNSLDEATVWYRKPEFVAPTSAFLTLTLMAILTKK